MEWLYWEALAVVGILAAAAVAVAIQVRLLRQITQESVDTCRHAQLTIEQFKELIAGKET